MKKLLCLLPLLLMMLSVANAEEWVSIEELRTRTPSHWTKTYETKWRTIVVDAEIDIPQVEKMPIVLIEGGAEEPTFTAADIGWDSLRFRGAYMLLIGRDAPDYPQKLNGVRLGTPFAEGNWYSDFSPSNLYVPLDDITFGEITKRAKTTLQAMGYEHDHFLLEKPVRCRARIPVLSHRFCEYALR